MAQVVKRLSEPDTRIVTLLGTGGVGKTRLAYRVARQITDVDEVVLAELAEVPGGDRERLQARLLLAVGILDNSAEDPTSRIVRHLGKRRVLLVLDNCEHVASEVVSVLRVLLRHAEGLRVLATSRAVLGLLGEHHLQVPPLSVDPPAAEEIDADDEVPAELRRAPEAVRLLVLRARARQVEIDPADPLARRAVKVLSGLPLAIEMLASRLHLRTLAEAVAGLDRTASSTSPRMDLVGLAESPRQRSMDACMDWSYSLLGDAHRRMWATVAEFRNPASLATIEAVAVGVGVERAAVEGLVGELVEQSILRVVQRGGRTRFGMLEPVRRHGLQLEHDQVDREQIRRVHAEHFAELARSTAITWYGPDEVRLMQDLGDSLAEFKAAVEYIGRSDDPLRAIGTAVDIVRSRFLIFWGQLNEVRRILALALDCQPPGARHLSEVSALAMASYIASIQGRPEKSAFFRRRCYELLDQLGHGADPLPLALRQAEGVDGYLVGDAEAAQRSLVTLQGVVDELAQHPDATGDHAMVELLLCIGWCFHGDARAIDRARAHLADTERAGAEWAISWAHWAVAFAEYLHGDPAAVREHVLAAVELQYRMRDRWGMAWLIWLESLRAIAAGQYEEGAKLAGAARAQLDEVDIAVPGLAAYHATQERGYRVCLGKLGDRRMRELEQDGAELSYDDAAALVIRTVTSGGDDRPSGFSERELEVARFVAQGRSNQWIAATTGRALRTIENQVTAAMRRVQVGNRAALAAWIVKNDPRA